MRELDSWYLGDGMYGDGPQFHWDYYNSFVMHPLLLEIFDREGDGDAAMASVAAEDEERAVRYAAIQERLISSGGNVSGDWAVAGLPVWRVSSSGGYESAGEATGGGCAGAGEVGADGGDATFAGSGGDV